MTATPPDLHDELARLAARAGAGPGPTGGELWDRGTRYRRRLRMGTAAIAGGTVLGLATLTGVSLQQSGPAPEPAPANAPAGLPSEIHDPSPWLPGTSEAGPPGQVVALLFAENGSWTGSDTAGVTVSAATGDYRFLDLPDWVSSASAETRLAPDGRHVAYWATGPVSGSPNTSEGGAPVSRLAVYDTVDGTVARHTFASEHGVLPDTLAWIDGSTLVASHYQLAAGDDGPETRQSLGTDLTSWVWDLAEGAPEQWDVATQRRLDGWGVPSGGRVAVLGRGGPKLLDADDLELRDLSRRLPLTYRSGNALSPDGSRIAGVWRQPNQKMPNDLAVVPLDSGGSAQRLTQVDQTFQVDGWIDDTHVAVTRRSEPVARGLGVAVYSVDVETGEPSLHVRLPEGQFAGVQWASDLLGSPVVDRPAPPTPLDPRWVAAGWGAIAVAGLLALWGWRRRVTP